jgi:rhamnose utilization protein RhaD (predicted bifunctional aldolase and dehydrogenase)/NAD(P)-dependent dehydrogenase (short-subunit alcohol dehydrogenase family)
MQSRWNDADARKAVETYARQGVAKELALRTYTTRLLGGDPLLVLHGGGNTSVKMEMADLLGETHEVLCVKGSGWDMGSIEPAGLPAVKLVPLRQLRSLDRLDDEDMVNFQRVNLLDSRAPNPSVETLLHAFLPHTYIDHTHAAAVLALVDQPNGQELVAEVYDGSMGLVPYAIPGFGLAKLAAQVYEAKPDVEGLILHKHGIFTFGADAREAYERMIAHVSRAEARLAKGRRNVFAARAGVRPLTSTLGANLGATGQGSDPVCASAAEVAPILRGAAAVKPTKAGDEPRRFLLDFRTNADIRNYVDGADLADYAQRGVVTPDHIIRTKNLPLIVPAPEAGRLDGFAEAVREAVADYAARYDAMFERQNARVGGVKTKLDASPRVALVPGVGLFGLGATAKDAAIAADLAENAIRIITDAEAIGRYEPLGEADLFDVEYWSLEQAKLKGAVAKAFTGQVAVVTGAGSGIGLATARAFASEGAAVAVLDLDGEAAKAAAKAVGGLGLACDVTDRAQVRSAFARIAQAFGGVDIVVSNAGATWQGRIGEVADEVLRRSFELNFFAHQAVAQEAVRIMLRQGTGGALLFNLSKQAVNPGPDFGPYGLPKAATLALMRQYAIDYGSAGIRANGVNADRIRTGLLTDEMVASRSKARGLSEADYMGGNLLKREVTAADVAQAFVGLAKARSTTGHIETVDGGNIAAALR